MALPHHDFEIATDQLLAPIAARDAEGSARVADQLRAFNDDRTAVYRSMKGRLAHGSASCPTGRALLLEQRVEGVDLVHIDRCEACWVGRQQSPFERLWYAAADLAVVARALTDQDEEIGPPAFRLVAAYNNHVQAVRAHAGGTFRSLEPLRVKFLDETWRVLQNLRTAVTLTQPHTLKTSLTADELCSWTAHPKGAEAYTVVASLAWDIEPSDLATLDPLEAEVISRAVVRSDGRAILQCSAEQANVMVRLGSEWGHYLFQGADTWPLRSLDSLHIMHNKRSHVAPASTGMVSTKDVALDALRRRRQAG